MPWKQNDNLEDGKSVSPLRTHAQQCWQNRKNRLSASFTVCKFCFGWCVYCPERQNHGADPPKPPPVLETPRLELGAQNPFKIYIILGQMGRWKPWTKPSKTTQPKSIIRIPQKASNTTWWPSSCCITTRRTQILELSITPRYHPKRVQNASHLFYDNPYHRILGLNI